MKQMIIDKAAIQTELPEEMKYFKYFDTLKKMGIVLKRALYFITCNGKMMYPTKIDEDYITRNLLNINDLERV